MDKPNNTVDIKTISTNDLKALAYDLNILLGRTQQNLKLVVDELNVRASTPPEVQVTEVPSNT